MIKNERQYRITRTQAENFRRALSELVQEKSSASADPLKIELFHGSIQSQLEELDAELRDYESIRENSPGLLEVHSLHELPRALIKARIASGLSQADLANRLGLKEQQVQRYEATDYAGVSIERIQEVIDALGIKLRNELSLPTQKVSTGTIFKRLSSAGLNRNFVESRLIPAHLRPSAHEAAPQESGSREALAVQIASAVGRIFNWTPDAIFGANPLELDNAVLAATRFKLPLRAKEGQVSAYTVYAHYLSLLTLECAAKAPRRLIQRDSVQVREEILANYGKFDLKSVVSYIWSLGVPVLPLRDPGAFHGACWRVGGMNVIAVKQQNVSHGRWIVDMLHELYHASENPEIDEFGHLDLTDVLNPENEKVADEKSATQFAVEVALGGRAEELMEECVASARGKVEWLKRAVPAVARDNSVDLGILANYLAYRLSLQKINWWPTATLFQTIAPTAWAVTRDIFLQSVDLGVLSDLDRELILRALSDQE